MVTVGVDPHKRIHQAAAVGGDGARVGRPVKVAADAQAMPVLRAWAGEVAGEEPVVWAIEGGPGLGRALADALVLAGQEVVWVPPRAMAAQRRLAGPVGAKSDLIDAVAVARAAMAEPGLARHRIDEPTRQIRLLVDQRSDLVQRRVAVTNRLQALLHTELDHRPGARGLRTRAALQRLHSLLSEAHIPEVVREVLVEHTQELDTLLERITRCERRLTALVTPAAPHLLALPGIGVVGAAVLLSQIGEVTRFPTSAKLARWAGCAPIPVYSSDRQRHRLHRGGNRHVNRVLHTLALTQARHHPAARAFIHTKQATKGTKGAYRALKRHLTDIVYRAMLADHTHQHHTDHAHQTAA